MSPQSIGRIAVLINPKSGRNKRSKPLQDKWLRQIESASMVFKVCNLQETSKAILQCREASVAVIVVQGGDGTVQMVLTELYRASATASYQPDLLLVPAGTTNMTHADVGSSLPLTVAVREAQRYLHGNASVLSVTRRHALRVTFVKQQQVVCGMFFGAGMIYSGILYCRQTIHTRGVRGSIGPGLALLQFIRQWIAGHATGECQLRLQCDTDETLRVNSAVMLVTTMRRLLLGLRPFWSVSSAPVKITVIEKNTSTRLAYVWRMLRGKNPVAESEKYRSFCCGQAELEIQGGFTIDGELFGDDQQCQQLHLQAVGPINFLA